MRRTNHRIRRLPQARLLRGRSRAIVSADHLNVRQPEMFFKRRNTFYIPFRFRNLPEARRAREVEAEFAAAIESEKKLASASGERVRLVSAELRRVQDKLQEARDAFDAAAGLPEPAPLTPRVLEEVCRLFDPAHRDEAISLLEKQCGRTIPFERDASSSSLEPYRLRVLQKCSGNVTDLKKWVKAANVIGRDILNGG
jgi:hypothetical protein